MGHIRKSHPPAFPLFSKHYGHLRGLDGYQEHESAYRKCRQVSIAKHHYLTNTLMFIGEYRHTFDAKNRISLPAKFRKGLGKTVIVTRGLDRCLFVYSSSAWKEEAKKLAQYSTGSAAGRGLSRLMLAGACEADLDSAGRILVPDYLKSFASLSTKAVVAGVNERVELWDEDAWSAYTAQIERDADALAESLA